MKILFNDRNKNKSPKISLAELRLLPFNKIQLKKTLVFIKSATKNTLLHKLVSYLLFFLGNKLRIDQEKNLLQSALKKYT